MELQWEFINGYETNVDCPYRRSGHSICSDGSKIYLIGGAAEEHLFGMKMYTYKYPNKDWESTETPKSEVLPIRRLAGCFHSLYDEKSKYLFIFGGYDGDNVLNDVWIYDIWKGVWEEKTPQIISKRPSPRSNFSSGVWKRNKVVIFGGLGLLHRDVYNDIYIYDHEKVTFNEIETIGSKIVPNLRSSGMVIHRDQVIIFGGYAFPDRKAVSRIFKLNLRNNTWNEIQQRSMISPTPRMFCNMVLMNGKGKGDNMEIIRRDFETSVKEDCFFYIFGGRDETMKERFSEVWRFDLNSHRWERVITKNTPVGRSGSAFCIVGRDFYVHGGSREATNGDFDSNKMSSLWKLRLSDNLLIRSMKYMIRTNRKPFCDVVIFTSTV